MWKLTISEEILIQFLDYFNIFALCEQFWKIRILGPLLRQKGSPLGPLFAQNWVPFLQFLGPLVIGEQCIWDQVPNLGLHYSACQLSPSVIFVNLLAELHPLRLHIQPENGMSILIHGKYFPKIFLAACILSVV